MAAGRVLVSTGDVFTGLLWLLAAAVVSVAAAPLVLLGIAFRPILPRRCQACVRLMIASVTYLAIFDVGALVGCAGLWIASRFGRDSDTPRFRDRYVRLNRSLIKAHCSTSLWLGGSRLDFGRGRIGPERIGHGRIAPRRSGHPTLVLPLHVGAFNTTFVPYLVGEFLDRPCRLVVRDTLAIDPAARILWRRTGTIFIPCRSRRKATSIGLIEELCRSARPDEVIVLFPEGTSFTPRRRDRAIAALRRNHRDWEVERALRMTNVLPPRVAGAAAAFTSAPTANVCFLAHNGIAPVATTEFDAMFPTDHERVGARCWSVPAGDIPTDPELRARWLYGWWSRIDAWIAEQRLPKPVTRSPAAGSLPEYPRTTPAKPSIGL